MNTLVLGCEFYDSKLRVYYSHKVLEEEYQSFTHWVSDSLSALKLFWDNLQFSQNSLSKYVSRSKLVFVYLFYKVSNQLFFVLYYRFCSFTYRAPNIRQHRQWLHKVQEVCKWDEEPTSIEAAVCEWGVKGLCEAYVECHSWIEAWSTSVFEGKH